MSEQNVEENSLPRDKPESPVQESLSEEKENKNEEGQLNYYN